MDNKSAQNGHNKLTISSSSMLPLPSSISRPSQPPPPLPLPLLAAGYVPPPKSPLCFSSSSPLAGGNISSESSSPSNCPISSSPSSGGLMPPIGSGGQISPNSICARRRVPTPLSFIAIREPSSQFHSPFFGQSSANSSALQSPQLFILNSPRTPASISLSPFLVNLFFCKHFCV